MRSPANVWPSQWRNGMSEEVLYEIARYSTDSGACSIPIARRGSRNYRAGHRPHEQGGRK
jgi:hypothetical protein